MSQINKKTWLYEISFMRPILLILLVSYHAFAPFCGTWEMPYGAEPNAIYKWIALFSRAFRLEAFVFVSGYVFAMQILQKNKFASLVELVKSKFSRLILPCWLFGVIYWAIFRTASPVHIFAGIGHLWYLPCLFWCFIFGFLLIKKGYKETHIILSLIALNAISFIPIPLQLNKAMYYLLFFYLGGVFWKYSKQISNKANLQNISLLLVIFCILLFGVYDLFAFNAKIKLTADIITKAVIYSVNNLAKAILAFVGITLLFMIASTYTRNHVMNERIVMIGTLGYGVYVFHQFVLKWLYYKSSLPYLVSGNSLPWIGLIIAIIISILLTIILRKTKFGRKLI